MILPLLFAVARGTLTAVSFGVQAYDGAKKLWRGKGPLPGAQGESQPLTFRDVERQRAQMQAATSKGTVTGPRPPAAAPDTVRSFPVKPKPPSSPPPPSAA